MYLFGGVNESEAGGEEPSDDLLKFTPRFGEDGAVESIYCVRIPSGESLIGFLSAAIAGH